LSRGDNKVGGAVIFTHDRDMGFYQRWILPRLIDFAMGADRLDAYRRRTIGAASGLVLEIGVGSGRFRPKPAALWVGRRSRLCDRSLDGTAPYGEEQDCRSAPAGLAD
jgi:hypothetical protein